MLGKRTVPGDLCILNTSPVSAAQIPGCSTRALSQMCHVFPLESSSLAVTLLADVNCPGSQEDLVSNWEPAHNLVEDAVSGAEIAPCLPAVAVTSSRQMGLWWGDGPVYSWLALLWHLVNPFSVGGPGCAL